MIKNQIWINREIRTKIWIRIWIGIMVKHKHKNEDKDKDLVCKDKDHFFTQARG